MKCLPVSLAMAASLAAANSAYASSSDWFEMEGARVRLVTAGAPDAEGRIKGVLDIDLKPGWKTYWRDPGESGVPPTVDVSSNPNVEGAALDFPAPQRHDEGDFQWAGYDYPVRLPVTFTLKDTSAGGAIDADVFLGVCETICVPVQAKLAVDPSSDPDNVADGQAVKKAFAAVPSAATPDFGVEIVETAGDKIVLRANLPDGTDVAELFIASEDGYVLDTPVREVRGGKTFFLADVVQPDEEPAGRGLPYTLVTGAGAVNGLLPYF